LPEYYSKPQTADEDKIVHETLQLFWQLHTVRTNFAQQWEEISSLILPEYRNTWLYGSYNWPGQKKTQMQVDSTGMLALQRFAAIADSLLTPANSQWHQLTTNNPYLNKNRRVQLYFEQATNLLFTHRYAPTAAFMANNHANYLSLGAFGTHAMFIDELQLDVYGRRGLRYRSVPLGELFIYEDFQGKVDGFIRWFRLTAYQAYCMFPDTFPEELRSPLEQNSQMLFDFLHHVCRRDDFDPQRKDKKGKPWQSCYISMTGKRLLREGGYRSFPLAVGRYVQAPGEVYGRSPASHVLPSLKTLNQQKKVHLKTAHRTADPVLLVNDDGLLDGIDLRPGALNKGGVTPDGRPLVHVLPTGQIQVSEEMMQEERQLINDAFLITLFQILTETPQMTATEVISRTAEKSILLAPTMARQSGEYLGSMIERELDILAYNKLLPKMPSELVEAGGEYEVVFTSPLAKAQRAQEAAGFMRTIESAMALVNATQDPSILDCFDFDTALIQIADIQAVPPSWLSSPKEIAAKRQAREKARQQQAQIQAMPAQAAMIKAQAMVQKNQVNAPGEGAGAIQVAPQGEPQFAGP
jgi:hypothetical protein